MHDHSLGWMVCIHPVFSQHVTSHLCVWLCLSCVSLAWALRDSAVWPSECGLNIVCPRLHSCHMNAGCVCTWWRIHYCPSHTSGFCALITEIPSCFCVMHQTAANLKWHRDTEEISPWNIKQKVPWRRLLFIYIHLQTKGLSNVACLLQLFECLFQPYARGLNRKRMGVGLRRLWANWW